MVNSNGNTQNETTQVPEIEFEINAPVLNTGGSPNLADLDTNGLNSNSNPEVIDLNSSNSNNSNNTNITNNKGNVTDTNDSNTTNTDTNTNNDEKPDDNNNVNTDAPDDNVNNDNYSDYSKTALVTQLLVDNGMQLFNEDNPLPKDLSPEQLVESINLYNNQIVEQKFNNRLQQLGRDAEYIQLKKQGVDMDQLDPAIQAEKYATFNVEDPSVTEDHLEVVVRAMYNKQLTNPDKTTIDGLIELDKKNNALKEKAIISTKFHEEFINNVKTQAKLNYENNLKQETMLMQQEADIFAEKLRNTKKIGDIELTDEIRSQIYDNQWKRDQIIRYQDEQGNEQVEYLTKYEVMIHQMVNNPDNLIKLHYHLMNNFSTDQIVGQVNKKVNQNILAALEGNTVNPVTNPTINVNNANNNTSDPQLLIEFDV